MNHVSLTYLCAGVARTISVFVSQKTIRHQSYENSGMENFQFMKKGPTYTCADTFGGNVVELTDQCLMKVTFLSVCSQTNVKGKAIWHTAPGDICGDLAICGGKTIAVGCV